MLLTHHFKPAAFVRSFKAIATFAVVFVMFASVYTSFLSNSALSDNVNHAPLSLRKCSPDLFNDDSATGYQYQILSAQEKARSSRRLQSTSAGEAVVEYKRRYRRNPPKGFEEWVAFALNHGSKIIDDFDQIDQDLKPYRTTEARQTFPMLQDQVKDCPRTARITIQNGTMFMSTEYMYGTEWRRLIQPVLHALPNSVFYLNTIDEPRILHPSKPQAALIEFKEHPGEPIEDLILESCAQVAP